MQKNVILFKNIINIFKNIFVYVLVCYNSHEKEILNPSLIILDKINMKY